LIHIVKVYVYTHSSKMGHVLIIYGNECLTRDFPRVFVDIL